MECQPCDFENENEHCDNWGDKGYCTTKFVKYMQGKCKQTCCQRAELRDTTQEKRTLALCDLDYNVFNDDYTPPPISDFDELILMDINCENFMDIKVKTQP